MTLKIGNKVVYPCQGPCVIGSIVEKVVADRTISFYYLSLLDDGGQLLVPVEKAQAIGLRLLLRKSEIPQLLDGLMQTTDVTKDWKQRAKENAKLLASGSAFDVAAVVESLTALRERKPLSALEGQTLEKARKLLVGEIAAVMEESSSAATERVDQALKARREARLPVVC
jgi:CarD family transcriptional regulator